MCESPENTDFAELMARKANDLTVDGKELVTVILESEHREHHRPGGQSQLSEQYVKKAIELVEDREADQ
jgi:hypothetical protein